MTRSPVRGPGSNQHADKPPLPPREATTTFDAPMNADPFAHAAEDYRAAHEARVPGEVPHVEPARTDREGFVARVDRIDASRLGPNGEDVLSALRDAHPETPSSTYQERPVFPDSKGRVHLDQRCDSLDITYHSADTATNRSIAATDTCWTCCARDENVRAAGDYASFIDHNTDQLDSAALLAESLASTDVPDPQLVADLIRSAEDFNHTQTLTDGGSATMDRLDVASAGLLAEARSRAAAKGYDRSTLYEAALATNLNRTARRTTYVDDLDRDELRRSELATHMRDAYLGGVPVEDLPDVAADRADSFFRRRAPLRAEAQVMLAEAREKAAAEADAEKVTHPFTTRESRQRGMGSVSVVTGGDIVALPLDALRSPVAQRVAAAHLRTISSRGWSPDHSIESDATGWHPKEVSAGQGRVVAMPLGQSRLLSSFASMMFTTQRR